MSSELETLKIKYDALKADVEAFKTEPKWALIGEMNIAIADAIRMEAEIETLRRELAEAHARTVANAALVHDTRNERDEARAMVEDLRKSATATELVRLRAVSARRVAELQQTIDAIGAEREAARSDLRAARAEVERLKGTVSTMHEQFKIENLKKRDYETALETIRDLKEPMAGYLRAIDMFKAIVRRTREIATEALSPKLGDQLPKVGDGDVRPETD